MQNIKNIFSLKKIKKEKEFDFFCFYINLKKKAAKKTSKACN